MKKILFSTLVLLTFTACHHETIEERAAREAKEYTQKMCPTPVVNFNAHADLFLLIHRQNGQRGDCQRQSDKTVRRAS